jgi:hypothetical protein
MMTVLYSLLSLSALAFLVFGPFNSYRVDLLRQRLFAIRAQLFLDAVDGKISLQGEAYDYTRTVLNGLLRFAHRASLSRLVAVAATVPRADTRRALEGERAVLRRCPVNDRKVAQHYLREANAALMKHVATSPFVGLLVIPCVAGLLTLLGISLMSWVIRKTGKFQSRIDAVAFELGRETGLGRGAPATMF